MEALLENLRSNLPGHDVEMMPLAHSVGEASPRNTKDGWDVPGSVLATAAQDLDLNGNSQDVHPGGRVPAFIQKPLRQDVESDPEEQPDHRQMHESKCTRPTCNLESQIGDNGTGVAAGLEAHDRQNSTQTEVVVRTLDWNEYADQNQATYDVLLVADVVCYLNDSFFYT